MGDQALLEEMLDRREVRDSTGLFPFLVNLLRVLVMRWCSYLNCNGNVYFWENHFPAALFVWRHDNSGSHLPPIVTSSVMTERGHSGGRSEPWLEPSYCFASCLKISAETRCLVGPVPGGVLWYSIYCLLSISFPAVKEDEAAASEPQFILYQWLLHKSD